ncbi:MAG: response regulator [Candidatus Nitrosopolaris sp.]
MPVDSFTDAFEVLENFAAGQYDLVILDVRLPTMNGFSLYEKIKKLDGRVRICFLTAADKTMIDNSGKENLRLSVLFFIIVTVVHLYWYDEP